jgi:hypothetical protein
VNLLVETDVECPWCGEYYATTVDTSQGGYVTTEDCAVCCRPIALTVSCEPGEILSLDPARG